MDISATFHLNSRECRSAIRNSPALRFRTVLISCALLAVFGLVKLQSSGPGIELYLGFGLPVFMEVVVHLAARKTATLFAEPWRVRVTDDALAMRTPVSQAEVGWNAYNAAWERAGFWYLRQASGAASFVPKRAFDGAQQAQLAEFFARQLPPPKISWYNPLSWQ